MQAGLLALALCLTRRSSPEVAAGYKLLRFLGVLLSTIPILGALQLLALRERLPSYANACGCQAIAGVAYFGVVSILLRC